MEELRGKSFSDQNAKQVAPTITGSNMLLGGKEAACLSIEEEKAACPLLRPVRDHESLR